MSRSIKRKCDLRSSGIVRRTMRYAIPGAIIACMCASLRRTTDLPVPLGPTRIAFGTVTSWYSAPFAVG